MHERFDVCFLLLHLQGQLGAREQLVLHGGLLGGLGDGGVGSFWLGWWARVAPRRPQFQSTMVLPSGGRHSQFVPTLPARWVPISARHGGGLVGWQWRKANSPRRSFSGHASYRVIK